MICRLILLSFYTVTTSCIHTAPTETKHVDLPEPSGEARSVGDLEVQSVIYRKSELPFEEFLVNLGRGRYKEALQKIHLSYHPSNNDNEAIAELIDAGFIPVYVSLTNRGQAPVAISENRFILTGSAGRLKALPVENIPHEFSHVDSKAVAANIYNTGVVVLSFAVILGVVALARNDGSTTPTIWPLDAASSHDPVYNEPMKRTHINFRDYLISEMTLAPGESKKGLLFFLRDHSQANADDKIEFLSVAK